LETFLVVLVFVVLSDDGHDPDLAQFSSVHSERPRLVATAEVLEDV
jgi:hypothetical protein